MGIATLVVIASVALYSDHQSGAEASSSSEASLPVSLQSSTTSSASTASANESASGKVSVQSTNASSTALSSSLSSGSGINESSRGLELSASTNSTIQEGQKLTITMSLLNSSPSPLIVPASDDWGVHGFPVALWSPCTGLEPLEFMVVKGNYTLDDLQA